MIEKFITYMRLELNRSQNTAEAYRRDLMQLADFLHADADSFDPSTVTVSDLRSWIASLGRQQYSPRTLRRKTQAARSFFRWLQRKGVRPDNPAADITLAKPDKPLPTFVREEEMENLLSHPIPGTDPVKTLRNHLIIELLYTCGLRQNELLTLTDSDITTTPGHAAMRVVGKGDKTRIIPLPDSTARAIVEWQSVRDELQPSPCHPAPLINGRGGAPLSKAGLYKIVRTILSLTSTARRSPHTLRHTFATAMVNGGAGINSVKEFLGHSSLGTTQIYTHLDFKQMQRDYTAAHPRQKVHSAPQSAAPEQENEDRKTET